MRLLIYTAAIWVGILAIMIRIEYMQTEVNDARNRAVELGCVHRFYEDASVAHQDAETAAECLWRYLGQTTYDR